MEIPIACAVRIYPPVSPKIELNNDINGNPEEEILNCTKNDNDNNNDDQNEDDGQNCCVFATPIPTTTAPRIVPGPLLDNGIAAGLIQVDKRSFPVTHALPVGCSQSQVYHQAVFPLISLFMEGFDASVVTYGQQSTGKTYTLYGPGMGCLYGEADQGVVQRCVREIFAHIANHTDRTYSVNIGWVEICGEVIRDLLGIGSVLCASVTDVFHWLQLGLNARSTDRLNNSHTLFTLTLEQQWISKENLIQHRLSTISFSDLAGTERLFMLNSSEQPTSLTKDLGLQALEQVVNVLTDPSLMYNVNANVPYNQTTLTTLLKDSFGGRAQTLIIICVSPFERDINETISNMQFAFKVQCVRNFVVMNTFSDDNTLVTSEVPENVVGVPTNLNTAGDNFGLQFAASQWFKLVSNAEGLFSKLISSNIISNVEKEQIEEWLFLKQECEDCLSSSEVIRTQKPLVPIQETDEPEETVSEPATSCQQNSDNESDSESQRPDMLEKLETLMGELCIRSDSLVEDKYTEYIEDEPEAVMESQESFRYREQNHELVEHNTVNVDNLNERKSSTAGRRRSIQPGASLSSVEIVMLNRVARAHSTPKIPDEFTDSSSELEQRTKLRAEIITPIEIVQKKMRKLETDIEARQRQINEVEQTMQLKQNIISDLIKNNDTRTTAKHRFNKKRSKLEAEYEKAKKQLNKAMIQGKDHLEIERLSAIIEHIEIRLQDLTSMKQIASESGQKIKKLQQSMQESKKLLEDLHKKVKKERKIHEQLDVELKLLKEKETSNKALIKVDSIGEEDRGKNLKDVQARISHLDHVLREKSENLAQFTEGEGIEEKEGLRHEIRNLRRTRDHLLEQRCSLDRKLKREKILSYREERKLLECDEAIEAIDAAIEFKNELICGHKSIDTSESLQREKGEQMLMARLNKLTNEEMRTLLYKYFTKVIDLRDSSRKLELQLMQIERERDAWEWKERVLSNAVRQARLEGERNAVLLQRQHEMKLTLMLRHLAEETASSASFSDAQYPRKYLRPSTLALTPHQQHMQQQYTQSPSSSSYADNDYNFGFPTAPTNTTGTTKLPKSHKTHIDAMEMCPLPDALNKYKMRDKVKEKSERETKNKLFAKFQLTRYAGGGQSSAMAMGASSSADIADNSLSDEIYKKRDRDITTAAIPEENLKRLMSTPSSTKVTRQKNKIIIQDSTRKN